MRRDPRRPVIAGTPDTDKRRGMALDGYEQAAVTVLLNLILSENTASPG